VKRCAALLYSHGWDYAFLYAPLRGARVCGGGIRIPMAAAALPATEMRSCLALSPRLPTKSCLPARRIVRCGALAATRHFGSMVRGVFLCEGRDGVRIFGIRRVTFRLNV
jgi:hypothetical protein